MRFGDNDSNSANNFPAAQDQDENNFFITEDVRPVPHLSQDQPIDEVEEKSYASETVGGQAPERASISALS